MTVPRDNPNDNITKSESFKFKSRFTSNTNNGSTGNVEIYVSLKYLSKFRRTFELSLINCDIDCTLTGSANCVICEVDIARSFVITDTKIYVLVGTFSTHDHTNIFEQLKSGFKRTINWYKYQSMQAQNQYLHYLICASFKGSNRLSVLLFEDNTVTGHTRYFLPKVKIKDYNVMIDGRSFFDKSVKNT